MKRIELFLVELFFGIRIEGEKLSDPTFRTVHSNKISFEKWTREINFGRLWMKEVDWKDEHRIQISN